MTSDREPLRIGLTGGIASGKSTVADLFAALGVPVIDTDVIARDLVEPGKPALDAIAASFGAGVIDPDGRLDRRQLRARVFADDDARARLEAILHPLIGTETLRRARAADGPYQLIVVPLLTDSSLRDFVDRVLVVDCDEAVQVQRLLARDAETPAQAQRMLAAQAGRDERLAIADDVIDNGGDLQATVEQVQALHRRYLDVAKHRQDT